MQPAVISLSLCALLWSGVALAAGDSGAARTAYVQAMALLDDDKPAEALTLLDQALAELGATNPRLQAALVRAAAAAAQPARTVREHDTWRSLKVNDADVNAELDGLRAEAVRVIAAERRAAAEALEAKARAEHEAAERLAVEQEWARAAEAEAAQVAIGRREREILAAMGNAAAAAKSDSLSTVREAIGAVEGVQRRHPDDPRVRELGRQLPDLKALEVTLADKAEARKAVSDLADADAAASRARGYYLKGTLMLVGGLGVGAGGVVLLAAQPIGKPASYALGGVSVGLGAAMAFLLAPDLFKSGARQVAARPVGVQATFLPGGGFVGVETKF